MSLLLGKSTSRLISAVLLLIAQFPFTLLAITLGGVTLHQVLAAYAAVLAYMLALGNLGLLCSVCCRTSRAASWLTGIFLAGFLFGPYLVAVLLTPLRVGGNVIPTGFIVGIVEASVVHRVGEIMQSRFADPVIGYQVISNLVAAVVFFCLSWAAFDVFIRDQDSTAPARRLVFKRTSRLRKYGAGRTWNNALAWKDFYFLAGGKAMMIVKFILYGILICGIVYFWLIQWAAFGRRSTLSREELGGYLMGISLVLILVELAFCASRIFYEEVKRKTLSGICMLPLSTAQIAYSKIAGCLIGLVPALAYFCLDVLIYPESFGEVLKILFGHAVAWFLIVEYVLFLHAVAFLSLFIKWGALPLTVAIFFLSTDVASLGWVWAHQEAPTSSW